MNCSCSTLHPSSIVLMNHSRKLWKFDRKLTMWPIPQVLPEKLSFFTVRSYQQIINWDEKTMLLERH